MKRFEGKVAVVTGGNSGIGLATAKAFAREGASVVITGRDEATLKSAAKEVGPGTLAVRADAAKMADLDAFTAQVKARSRAPVAETPSTSQCGMPPCLRPSA